MRPESLIGEAKAVAGLGPNPFTDRRRARVHHGPIPDPRPIAPFGLSVVIPADAGPFDFGNVVTRSAIDVDPSTAQLTIGSALPTMVNTVPIPHGGVREVGAPVQLRRVDVTIERPGNGFQFNPTNCSPLAITGTVSGDQGGGAPDLRCRSRSTAAKASPFEPTLTAETNSRWSRLERDGPASASSGEPGQANIHTTKIVFPAAAALAPDDDPESVSGSDFAANPASCPEGSVIGTASRAHPGPQQPARPVPRTWSHTAAPRSRTPSSCCRAKASRSCSTGRRTSTRASRAPRFNAVPDAPVSKLRSEAAARSALGVHGLRRTLQADEDRHEDGGDAQEKVGRKGHRTPSRSRRRSTSPSPKCWCCPTTLGGQNGDKIEETLR